MTNRRYETLGMRLTATERKAYRLEVTTSPQGEQPSPAAVQTLLENAVSAGTAPQPNTETAPPPVVTLPGQRPVGRRLGRGTDHPLLPPGQ